MYCSQRGKSLTHTHVPHMPHLPSFLYIAGICSCRRLTERVRRSLGFDGIHVHYSCDNDLALGRRGRRTLLRHIEALAAVGSKEESAAWLAGLAAKKQGRA